jgi:hypothetical protein
MAQQTNDALVSREDLTATEPANQGALDVAFDAHSERDVAARDTASDSARDQEVSPKSKSARDLAYVGPIKRLNDLPQGILNHLDEVSAAKLHEAIEHPEQFPPDFLDHTSIRGLHATGPASGSPDDGEPWYHSPLPPVRLEVALVKYDWMVNEAIERAANRIDQLTESKMDGKIKTAMFYLQCELRNLLR